MLSSIDEVAAKLSQLPDAKLKELEEQLLKGRKATGTEKWMPTVGPQADAYDSHADVLLFGGEPGGGKLLSRDTPIATPLGWTTMGELRVGDWVLSDDGKPCRVTFKSDVQYETTYRLRFSDGSAIVAGARHQWVTSNRSERNRALKCNEEWRAQRRMTRPLRGTGKKPWLSLRNSQNARPLDLPTSSIKTTQEIVRTLRRYDGGINHAIAVAKPLDLPSADVLIDPYVLGVWLGDGTHTAATLTGIDEEIFLNVANSYSVTRHANPKQRGVLGLQKHLRQLGLEGNKHIPQLYLRASKEQRLDLLQGLMDTDGYCDVRGQCEFTQVRKHLAVQFRELLTSLGIKSSIREGQAKLNGVVTGPNYRIKFLTDLPVFRLARKLIRQKRTNFRGTHDVRYIVAAEEIPQVPMQCIQVDSPSRMYLCGETMIPTHNTELGLGLAFTRHKRSLFLRRQYTDLGGAIDAAVRIHGSRDGFNGQPPPRLTLGPGNFIDFAGCARIGDEQHWMGQPHDLIVPDETTQFAEMQIRFLMGWLRHEDPKQRTRILMPTNPPLSSEGLWVLTMFAPWLDDKYPYPAKPGELRWVVTDDDGKEIWVDGPQDCRPVVIAGKTKLVAPKSRTFIPSSVEDNPWYAAGSYRSQLDAMPEPHRSILLGKFKTTFKDQPNQVIPTAWVKEAQARWTKKPPTEVPMCAIGVDCSGGGEDPMMIAARHDGWFAPLVEVPAKSIPMDRSGAYCGGIIVGHRRDNALVVVDLGGGYGGPTYEHLKANDIQVTGYKGAEKTKRRSKCGKLSFLNKRSAALWAFREALDPGQPGGSPISLPEDPVLLSDLTAPTFEPTPSGIKVESKEDVCERLGRSTDRGDAVVMCWFEGPKEVTNVLEWQEQVFMRKGLGRRPMVISGRRQPYTAQGQVTRRWA